ncbi:MAG: glycoside hydrolase family 88 protein [Bacilli bacterium]|nr:glycoside hydrolase family 88 protein [Bacilli bacterium]
MEKHNEFDRVVQLADEITATWDPKMKWMWGEALLGYALTKLDDHLGNDSYTDFLTAYCDYYVKNPPLVDQSDTAAPGLITYAMYKKTKNPEYKQLTDRVLDYIVNTKRVLEDSPNHLGSSLIGKFYPRSIWVDSLMMFSVFPSLYAKENKDAKLLDIASRQPRIFSKYMQDPNDGLWYHSYWVKQKTHYPRKKLYWGRGNGWVIAALPMILDNIGEHVEREAIIDIFKKTSEALYPYQRDDGTFETVLNRPGKTYRELSATALIAAGWFHGCRIGVLDDKFRVAARKAFKACASSIHEKNGKLVFPEISAPTIPLPVFPYLGYKLTPKGDNWSYGLAALIFAAIEYDQDLCFVKTGVADEAQL